ncbi:hypothetical protein WHI96_21055 [Pseudonocardia tropica]|uniref:Uncharacterized protein n=1 Tax=Pseudonocardia tropica TaxID=681289 RepID=A0ABV1JZD5_9PSEU
MAIADVEEFAHLTDADVEAIGRELDAIRADVEERRGQYDADHIRTMITWQRRLNVAAPVALFGSRIPPLRLAGTAMLSVARILENTEIGQHVTYGRWDWPNDPEIRSSTCTTRVRT